MAEPERSLASEIVIASSSEPVQAPDLEPERTIAQTDYVEPLGPDPEPTPESERESKPAQPNPEPAQVQTQTLRRHLLNLPLEDLFSHDRTNYFTIIAPLYKATMEGDWETAKRILEQPGQDYSHLLRCSITSTRETMLHVAVSAQRTEFVQNLVGRMQREDFLLQNIEGNTALCLAAKSKNVDIAMIMVDANQDLLTTHNNLNLIPLYIAAVYGNRDMVNYLYTETNSRTWTDESKSWVYLKCIESDLFDVALRIFQDHTELAQLNTSSVLQILARKPYAFDDTKQDTIFACFKVRSIQKISDAMKLLRNILDSIQERPASFIHAVLRGPKTRKDGVETHPSRALFIAAEMGNTKFIVELMTRYHDLIWMKNDDQQSIFHVAVSYRNENIFNLSYEIGLMKDFIIVDLDKEKNTILHLVGNPTMGNRPRNVTGAAVQMQRELLWYKEIESMVPLSYRERKNNDGKTPHEIFTDTHIDLVSEGEKWMKGTASKSMVVAALIATIVFGVAFTIPGGYNQNNGFPMFIHKPPFIVFVILDSISLILSATSILVFLSILTSRYAQEDFIESLPKKLMAGLSMLFVSIVTMMIAFSVSFYVLYREKFIIVAGFISLFAIIPIVSYARLQYPLVIDIFRSTYGSRYLFKHKKQMLYNKNPTF